VTLPTAQVRGGRRKLAPHWRMLLGLAVGAAVGVTVNLVAPDAAAVDWVIQNVTEPIGKIFINLLMMLVAPLLFAALVIGISEIDLAQLGRLGAKMFGYTILISSVAVGIGLLLVNLVRPGEGGDELVARANEMADKASQVKAPDQSVADFLIGMVPDNVIGAAGNNARLLGLILFSVMFGIALLFTRTPAADRLREFIQGLYDVLMRLIDGILWVAPFGVAALLFSVTARLGFDIIQQLGAYVAVVVLALAIHMFVVYSLSVRFLGGMSPIFFFRGVKLAMVTAFSTSSSSATLPVALDVAEEELRLPRHVSRFVLTAGSAMNQNGTALFEGVTVLFLAQLFGVDLSVGQQLAVMGICILGGIGTAGVPAGSLPVVVMILGLFHIPPQGIGLILGVDRFLDMCRTSLNVVGDLAAAVYVAAGERTPHPVADEADSAEAQRSEH
jgi:dicarboxylate/amino acid:cation (Na+ or H+) symporter, DAACS family